MTGWTGGPVHPVMSRTGGLAVIDLDSHLMEPRDFLVPFAPAKDREHLVLETAPETSAVSTGEAGLWSSFGAFDRTERGALLDRLGIAVQVVLPGIAQVAHLGSPHVVAAARAQRRAVLAWADGDPRFVPVAVVPLDEPHHAVELVAEAAEEGVRAVLLTTARSRPAPPHEHRQARLWDAIADTGLVAVLHFGTTGVGQPDAWRTTDPSAGPDAADAMDVVVAHHGAEAIVARLALAGVFAGERPPRVLIAEHGAGWLPGLCVSLDACQRSFRHLDPAIPQGEPLSAQVIRALTVVPFVFEPVGALIDRVGPEVLGFATDHPHPEGGRDPARTFAGALGERDTADFFDANARRLLGL